MIAYRDHARASSGDSSLKLGVEGFEYADLYTPERLRDLSDVFYDWVVEHDRALWLQFDDFRNGATLPPAEQSALLTAMASRLSEFIARLFNVEEERVRGRQLADESELIHRFKREFVDRRAVKKHPNAGSEPAVSLQDIGLDADGADAELATARTVLDLLGEEAGYPKGGAPADLVERLAALERWAAVAAKAPHNDGAADWPSLHLPEPRTDPWDLVELVTPDAERLHVLEGPAWRLRRRDGFDLTDPRWDGRRVMENVHYCVLCHEREKDSCARGYPLPRNGNAPDKNALGVTLSGCPLTERIGEAHALKLAGDALGALAIVMIDNPMCPGTGHRICNDCMKSCIYQKQEPVNIPQIETHTVSQVLEMPYGVEIYGLLTRWNPLNVKRPYPLPYSGYNVLVDGLGPAGYTLSQWLLNEGFGVVGLDGLKIEPLPEDLLWDGDVPPRPIRDFNEIQGRLSDRVAAGFGGVSEYGITVRWDKNFLKLMYLTLMRRPTFRVYGGVRFGGTFTVEDAWAAGFHHVAIAAGAGRPTMLNVKNNLLPGIAPASDFLMALQLTGAFKKSSLANFMMRLPVVVVGGGLTAVDACTEALAYYPVQVEKLLEIFEELVAARGGTQVLARLTDEDKALLEEQLAHARAIRAERERAQQAGEAPNFVPLLQQWGGATLCYRKRLHDSPAYRVNHEEIQSFLEEGVRIVECLEPTEAVPDKWGRVAELKCDVMVQTEDQQWQPSGETVTLAARTVLVAAGTTPNIIYEKEHPGNLELDERRKFFKPHRLEGGQLLPAGGTPADPGFFTSYARDGRYVSFFGDNHPAYAGSVVKAMASAKNGYGEIAALFPERLDPADASEQARRWGQWRKLTANLEQGLVAHVESVTRLTPTILEIAVRAPYQAEHFQPGQFFRFQNFESTAPLVDGRRLQTEAIALTGAWVNKSEGIVGLIALEVGVSSRLCATLVPGRRVVLMGPTGEPTHVGSDENVVLAGGGLGNAVLFSLAEKVQAEGNRVLYFAAYKNREDVFHRDEIEAACDQVIWSVDAGELIQPRRPQDRTFLGNVVQAMVAYDQGELGDRCMPLDSVHRLIAIGSDRMMAAVAKARHDVLAGRLNPEHAAMASINSPMQCMMKAVCGHCVQKHIDPASGTESIVFSCFDQDQPMDQIDWKNLNDRLRQNSLGEKLSAMWLDLIFERYPELKRV